MLAACGADAKSGAEESRRQSGIDLACTTGIAIGPGAAMFGFFKRSRKSKIPVAVADGGGDRAWIFVSHASADLANVRKVRNYLEEKGAAPLLFHLRALTNPTEFWP